MRTFLDITIVLIRARCRWKQGHRLVKVRLERQVSCSVVVNAESKARALGILYRPENPVKLNSKGIETKL